MTQRCFSASCAAVAVYVANLIIMPPSLFIDSCSLSIPGRLFYVERG